MLAPGRIGPAEIEMSSREVLRSDFTPGAIIITVSSYALREFEAQRNEGNSTPPDLVEIGSGLQGAIFEHLGNPLVLKKEWPGNAKQHCCLKREYRIHRLVQQAFGAYAALPSIDCRVRVPKAHRLERGSVITLPTATPDPPNVMQMERVLPLPKNIRRALIDHFYPFPSDTCALAGKDLTEELLSYTPNKHCLVRPYLGMSRKQYAPANFSLRNFVLSLDDLNCLAVDTHELSRTLGKAYAIMHWGANVDGDDVEFVFGSTVVVAPTGASQEPYIQHREITLHLIDFGQCEEVNMKASPDVVLQAFKGAMVTGDNACFIPNCRRSPELFNAFVEEYSKVAKHIVRAKGLKVRFDINAFMKAFQEYAEDFH